MASTPAAAASSQNVVLPYIPELNNPNFLDIFIPAGTTSVAAAETKESSVPANSLMEALKDTSLRTVTENNANAYSSTGDTVLDAFYSMKVGVLNSDLRSLLEQAWAEDPTTTLKTIWNVRSIHDGKGEKEMFYQAWGWLYQKHPRTAIENLHLLVDPVCKINKEGELAPHGYWKDLLNLVCLAALDQLGPCAGMYQPSFLYSRTPSSHQRSRQYRYHDSDSCSDDSDAPRTRKRAKKVKVSQEEAAARTEKDRADARQRRVERHAELQELITHRLSSDSHFRALYIAVARIFADQLAKDILTLDQLASLPVGPDFADERQLLSKRVSFAGKWAPTPGCSHDRHSNMATAISMLLHFSQAFQTPSSVSITPTSTTPISGSDAHTLRSFYQRWIIRPLRAHAACPEPLMSSNRWKEIRYTRVPSKCMQNNMPHFYLHDPEGFEKYLAQVEKGVKKISGATLMPHEILADAMACHDGVNNMSWLGNSKVKPAAMAKIKESRAKLLEVQVRTVEAQWKTMLERVKEAGKLENSLAVCDVSGSMGFLAGTRDKNDVEPIMPAVALSILLAQLAEPPFNGGFITFSANPEFVRLNRTQTLAEMATHMVTSSWSLNTDFEAVFLKLLLPLAKEHNVQPDDMVKRLFVFSDMQFDESRSTYRRGRKRRWETSHDVVERAYKKAGYEVPEIVYWNLAVEGTVDTTPVKGDKKGVALVSGFSPNMLKVFMGLEVDEEKDEETEMDEVEVEGEGEVEAGAEAEEDGKWLEPLKGATKRVKRSPREVMMQVLGKASFSGLVVVD